MPYLSALEACSPAPGAIQIHVYLTLQGRHWLHTYKHGGDVVRKRVGNDGEAGRDEGRSAERLDHTYE